MEEPTQETEQLLKEYQTIWNERDYSKIPDIVSESFVRVSPVAEGGAQGYDGLQELIRGLETGFSDFHVTINNSLVSDDIAMVEGTFTGTHDGEFNDITPTQREVELRFMDKFRVEDGKVQEHRTYYNPQELLEQLGVTDE